MMTSPVCVGRAGRTTRLFVCDEGMTSMKFWFDQGWFTQNHVGTRLLLPPLAGVMGVGGECQIWKKDRWRHFLRDSLPMVAADTRLLPPLDSISLEIAHFFNLLLSTFFFRRPSTPSLLPAPSSSFSPSLSLQFSRGQQWRGLLRRESVGCKSCLLAKPLFLTANFISFHFWISSWFWCCSKNSFMNYTEVEKKVREATSNEPWGASHDLLMYIARATHSV